MAAEIELDDAIPLVHERLAKQDVGREFLVVLDAVKDEDGGSGYRRAWVEARDGPR